MMIHTTDTVVSNDDSVVMIFETASLDDRIFCWFVASYQTCTFSEHVIVATCDGAIVPWLGTGV